MSVTAIHLIIHGRVQGVGYRAWAASTARGLGLTGWVRNRCDGTVEAVIAGEKAMVQRMLQACHEGSPIAKVSDVESSPWSDEVPYDFSTRPTV
jgi:acylphosphatase